MITLVFSPKQHLPKDMQHSVGSKVLLCVDWDSVGANLLRSLMIMGAIVLRIREPQASKLISLVGKFPPTLLFTPYL